MIRLITLTQFRPQNYRSTHKSPKFASKIERYIPEKLKPLWNHEAGPQTVFFWAPLSKWGLVFAGLADITRDPSTLSTAQTIMMMATGLIWSRYCLVIVPKNYFLFGANMFVFLTQSLQMFRILTCEDVKTK